MQLGAIYVLAVLALSLGGVAGWQHYRIAELSVAIDASEQQTDSLRADLAKTKRELSSERQTGNATLYRLQVEKDEALAALAALKGRIAGLEVDLAGARTQLYAERASGQQVKREFNQLAAEKRAAEQASDALETRLAKMHLAMEAERAKLAEQASQQGQARMGREAALSPAVAPAAEADGVPVLTDSNAAPAPVPEAKPEEQKAALAEPERKSQAAEQSTPSAVPGAAAKAPAAVPSETKPKKQAKRKKKPEAEASFFSF